MQSGRSPAGLQSTAAEPPRPVGAHWARPRSAVVPRANRVSFGEAHVEEALQLDREAPSSPPPPETNMPHIQKQEQLGLPPPLPAEVSCWRCLNDFVTQLFCRPL